MKAIVLAENSVSYYFSLDSLGYSDVYRCESGRCCTLFIISFTFYINTFHCPYQHNLPQGTVTVPIIDNIFDKTVLSE